MKNWFTSDLHFYHDNIIKYCNRPYENVKEMNAAIFDELELLPAGDVLWVLGDVCMGGAEKAREVAKKLASLPVKIKIIGGNHDRSKIKIFQENGLIEHPNGRHLIQLEGKKVSVGHFPAVETPTQGVLYLCGHVHDAWVFQKFGKMLDNININCNVGIDVWGHPVTLETVLTERDDFYGDSFSK